MKELLERLIRREQLSVEESRKLMISMLSDAVSEAEIAAVLMALQIRGVSLDELDGFSQAVLELSRPVDLTGHRLIDVCGTGGDNKGSFNISTTVAFVLAGAGYKVAKHGNYAVSSACGSSNVLEELGVKLSGECDAAQAALDRAGVCFLHAPLFHPVLKRVQPVRKALKVRTVFNVLGPLVNPARPDFVCTGVYDLELQRLYTYLLTRRGTRFAVVHSLDGYDEISLTGIARVSHNNGMNDLAAEDFGFAPIAPVQLQGGGTPRESAVILQSILEGEATDAQQNVVLANAALAMWQFEGGGVLVEWVEKARESILSGRAKEALQRSRG
jgi:anthranilate phosphoribosyltransferase